MSIQHSGKSLLTKQAASFESLRYTSMYRRFQRSCLHGDINSIHTLITTIFQILSLSLIFSNAKYSPFSKKRYYPAYKETACRLE